MEQVELDSIQVGDRQRKDVGNLDSLIESMKELGVLHPVVVTPDHQIVAGCRRLEAAKLLGWTKIAVHTVEIDQESMERAELDENRERLDLPLTDKATVWHTRMEVETPAAKERELSGKRSDDRPSGKFPEGSGRASDLAATGLGESGKTLEKAWKVVCAAEDDPERFGEMPEKMDQANKVNGVYKEIAKVKRDEELASEYAKACRDIGEDGRVVFDLSLERLVGTFRTIYADPPWAYDDSTTRGAAAHHYPTMDSEEMIRVFAKDIGAIANPKGSHFWMWTTWPMLRDGTPQAFLSACGFEWKSELVWNKEDMGLGHWLRKQTEILILGVKGTLAPKRDDLRDIISIKRTGEHSEKPYDFYEIIESFSPGTYLELFSRMTDDLRPGWMRHGNQAEVK